MRYHNITFDDMLNGDGLRVVLWVSGCEHGCSGCHNEITWDINSGIIFDDSARDEIFYHLNKDYISGLTLSGGDPLHVQNREEIFKICNHVKRTFPNKNIWLYTGYKFEDVKHLDMMSYIDVLVDGKFIESLNNDLLYWRGSSNQRVIDVKQSINSNIIKTIC